ncbi:MAG: ABC transporter permease [Oscillospiraceae bacterium]|nr:ABC transporter permease [Oscillospiraceae bacterium]
MAKYVLKRILMMIPIVLGVILVVFAVLYFIPGSRIRSMPSLSGGDALDSVYTFLRVGDNFLTKYVRYCYNVIAKFDFGTFGTTARLLTAEMSYRLRNTVFLLISGVAVTVIAGIPVGVYAATRKDRPADRIVTTISLFLSSIPNYAIAMVLTLLLCVNFRLLPLIPVYTEPIAYLLPAITISLGGLSSISRITRTSVLEVLEQPYITALRSKGVKETSVVWRHALKNALVPVVSTLGGLITQLLCGTLVVEYFFNVPGLGTFMLRSVTEREHMSILACTVLMTLILSATNTSTDILYAFFNPQIRLRYSKRTARNEE